MKTLLSLLFATLVVATQAQRHSITGNVFNKENIAVEGATVTLLNEDSVLLRSDITSREGKFSFDRLDSSNFLLQISHSSYEAFYLSVTSPTNRLQIHLTPKVKELTAVQVTSKRPFIENKIDKMVVNVDASPASTGLTAMELLEKSPGVSVDNDGNISLKGKQGVMILIDGRPTNLSGQDLANYLKSLSSAQLDQLEIMSQPPAKYDASGNSGVINIKTKKNKANGFNTTVTAQAIFGRTFKHSNGIVFNLRQNKWNLFGNYNFTNWTGFNILTVERSYRTDRKSPFFQYLNQRNESEFYFRPHNMKLGADYFASKSTTLGFTATGLLNKSRFSSASYAETFDANKALTNYIKSTSAKESEWENFGLNLNFKQVLNAASEITADADYYTYKNPGKQFLLNTIYNPDGSVFQPTHPDALPNPYHLNGEVPSEIAIYSFKSDYLLRLKNDASLEAGIKVSRVTTDNNAQYNYYDAPSQKWLPDARTNRFKYDENISAAYISYRQQIKKFGIQLGLRAEQTNAKGKQAQNSADFSRSHTDIFPTAYVNYQPSETSTFGISYSRRIERPNYENLNPFVHMIDNYTYQQGNPLLRPQFSNNVELSYNFKGQINASVGYSVTDDIINEVLYNKTNPDGTQVTYQTNDNIAKRVNISLNLNYTKAFTKWFTLMAYNSLFNNEFEGFIGTEKVKIDRTTFQTNITTAFTLGKAFTAEVSGFYHSKSLVSSNILSDPQGMLSFGLKKQFLNNRATVALNVRDPFEFMSFRGQSEMNQYYLKVGNDFETRRIAVTLMYRFGKNLQQQQRKTGASVEENRRINTGQ